MTRSAEGRVALVTGANKGIGFAIARALGELGLTVLIGARDERRGQGAADQLLGESLDVEFVKLDLTDEASIRVAAAWIAERFGRLDVLVNNAAIKLEFHPSPPSCAPLSLVRETFETNVFGTMAVIQAMIPLLLRSPAARIVNLSSGLGSISMSATEGTKFQQRPLLSYNVAKAALNSLTVQFANELRHTTVKVNAADPGFTNTDMTKRSGDRQAAQAAAVAVRLATLPDDGPTAGFFDEWGPVAW